MRAVGWGMAAVVAAGIAVPATAGAAAPPTVGVSASPIAASLSSKPAKASVAVQNTGKARVSGLTLTVASRAGVKVTVAGAKKGKRSRKLKPLAAGKTVRVTVTLRRKGKGPRKGTLGYKVTRKGKTVASGRVAFGAGKGTQPTTPSGDPNSLAGRYFWGSRYTVSGIEQNPLYFTGPNLVSTAATEGVWPACPAPSDTCKPYTYNAAANQLTIDGKPAALFGRKLSFDDNSYLEFGYPAAGARWDTRVTYSNSSGICPLYCSYYTENLTFLPTGQFVRDAVSSGSGPIVDWASVPPDSKGIYEVRADHTLRLLYEDGKERIETVALYLNDDGTLQPPGQGIVLGGDGYFDIRD